MTRSNWGEMCVCAMQRGDVSQIKIKKSNSALFIFGVVSFNNQ